MSIYNLWFILVGGVCMELSLIERRIIDLLVSLGLPIPAKIDKQGSVYLTPENLKRQNYTVFGDWFGACYGSPGQYRVVVTVTTSRAGDIRFGHLQAGIVCISSSQDYQPHGGYFLQFPLRYWFEPGIARLEKISYRGCEIGYFMNVHCTLYHMDGTPWLNVWNVPVVDTALDFENWDVQKVSDHPEIDYVHWATLTKLRGAKIPFPKPSVFDEDEYWGNERLLGYHTLRPITVSQK